MSFFILRTGNHHTLPSFFPSHLLFRITPNSPMTFSILLQGYHPILPSFPAALFFRMSPHSDIIFHTTPSTSPHPSFLDLSSSERHPFHQCHLPYYSHETTSSFFASHLLFRTSPHPPMSFSILLPGDHLILHSFCLWPLVFRMLLHPTDAIFHSTPRRSVHPSILLSLTSTLQNVTPFHQCHFPYCSQEITQSFTPFSLHLYSLGCHPIPPVSFSILLPGDHPILQSFFPWPLLFRVSSHSTNAIFHTTPMRSPNPFTPFFLHIYSLGCHPIPPMSLSILLPEDHSILTFFFPWPLLFRMSPQSTKVIFHTTLRRSTHSSFLDIYSSEWHPTSFQCYLHTTLRRSPHPPLLFFFTATLQNVTPFYQSHFPHYSQVINPFFFPWPILFRMSPHTTNVIYILLSGDHPILHPFFSFTATLQNVTPFYQSHFPYYSQVINPFFFPWPPYSSECHPIPPMLFSILLSGDHPMP